MVAVIVGQGEEVSGQVEAVAGVVLILERVALQRVEPPEVEAF